MSAELVQLPPASFFNVLGHPPIDRLGLEIGVLHFGIRTEGPLIEQHDPVPVVIPQHTGNRITMPPCENNNPVGDRQRPMIERGSFPGHPIPHLRRDARHHLIPRILPPGQSPHRTHFHILYSLTLQKCPQHAFCKRRTAGIAGTNKNNSFHTLQTINETESAPLPSG